MSPEGRPELERLAVVERLEVGPVRVEPDRASARYLTRGRAGEEACEIS